MSDQEYDDYPSDYEFKEDQQDFVLGGQMYEAASFRDTDLDLELVAREGELIRDPEDRFKIDVKMFANEIITRGTTIRSDWRKEGRSGSYIEQQFILTEDDLGTLIHGFKRVDFLGLKNPLLYVLGYMQSKQTTPINNEWLRTEVLPVHVYLYARYWKKILS